MVFPSRAHSRVSPTLGKRSCLLSNFAVASKGSYALAFPIIHSRELVLKEWSPGAAAQLEEHLSAYPEIAKRIVSVSLPEVPLAGDWTDAKQDELMRTAVAGTQSRIKKLPETKNAGKSGKGWLRIMTITKTLCTIAKDM